MKKRLGYILAVLLSMNGLVFAQATAAINGRVVDPADAVVPNATVTITNLGTGVARDSVTNAEGLYTVPALTPGNYGVKVRAQGFETADRSSVELLTGATLSVDFKLQVGAVQQTVEVGAQTTLVETSQAVATSSIRQEEVTALPMLNRTMSSLMVLMPGTREAGGAAGAANYISIGGGTGHNFNMLVDGMDNKEDTTGGVDIEYSLDGLQEFKTMTTGAAAEYGKGVGNLLAVTKSGTNAIHGTGFGFYRNQDLIKTDYLSLPANGGLGNPPFSREQYGGSIGGPIIKDKVFYFGSVERVSQNFSLPVSSPVQAQLSDLLFLNNATGYAHNFIAVAASLPQPTSTLLTEGKISYLLNSKHSAFIRYGGEILHNQLNGSATTAPVTFPYQQKAHTHMFNVLAGETFVINPTTVNQFTAQWASWTQDTHYPPCPLSIPNLGVNSCVGDHLNFLSVATSAINSFPDYDIWERKWQFRNDLSKQLGRHALKIGVDYAYVPLFSGLQAAITPGNVSFFADPSTIINNTNGLYPQGFATPGIVAGITEWSGIVGNLGTPNNWEIAAYGQDDFKLTPRVTLNLGLRWEAYNLGWDTAADRASNITYKILQAIGSPYAKLPTLPNYKNYQPRLGLAWDVAGNGKNVVRISYGIFYLQQLKLTNYPLDILQKPFPQVLSAYQDSKIGQGLLSNFIFGVTALPNILAAPTTFPTGSSSTGYWYDPNNTRDGQSQQFHGGIAHVFGDGKDVLSADYTYLLLHHGFRTLDINPLLNGVRPMAAATQALYGDPKLLGPVYVESSQVRAVYSETAVRYEHRFSPKSSFQVNYVLAWSNSSGGNGDGSQANFGSVVYPQIASTQGGVITAPWEYGPTGVDERHRITALGLFTLPFKIDLSPSMTWATARPYTEYCGANTSGDGLAQCLGANGNPVGIDTLRGSALFILNSRVTRNFVFGKDGRFVAAPFAEFYNITNRPNFGNVYGGVKGTPTFEKPTGYLGGNGATSTIPNSFQVQFGGRITF